MSSIRASSIGSALTIEKQQPKVLEEAFNFIKKETLAQVFSCKYCEISNNTFFIERLRATAFVDRTENKKTLLWLDSLIPEAASRGALYKKMFLKILQNLQENSCVRVSLLKRKLWHRCFPVNFTKFPRTSFFIEHLLWLNLQLHTLTQIYNCIHQPKSTIAYTCSRQ